MAQAAGAGALSVLAQRPGRPNRFLGGWREYYAYGNSTRCFAKLDQYVAERVALLLSKRHGRRGRGHGMKHIVMSGNRLGLVRLVGSVRFGAAGALR